MARSLRLIVISGAGDKLEGRTRNADEIASRLAERPGRAQQRADASEYHRSGEMDTNYSAIAPLQAMFDAAKQFGLTDDEVWQTVNDSLCGADDDATVGECLQELAGALARRILSKQRRILADGSSGSR